MRKRGKKACEPMNELISRELASLLASTEDMLSRPDPSLAAWQGYTCRRSQVFQRLQELQMGTEDSVANCTAVRQLITSVLEIDQMLVQKIGRQLSNISQEMAKLADRRRVFNAYARDAQPQCSYHHRTA